MKVSKITMGVLAIMLGFSVIFSNAAFSEAALKMGYVDLRKVFMEYEKSKTYDKELNDLTAKLTADRDKLVAEIKTMKEESQLLSDKAKEAKEGEITAKINELNQMDQKARQEFITKKNDMFKEVIDDIQAVVNDMAQKEKYDYIIDYRNLMFAKESYDLTARVIETLNKK